MKTHPDPWGMSPLAAQLLAAIAADQDDIASNLGDLAVLSLYRKLYKPLQAYYTEPRAARIDRMGNDLHRREIWNEAALAHRLQEALRRESDDDDEIPF